LQQPDPAYLLGEVRHLTRGSQRGGASAFDAFRDLVSLLLSRTVLALPTGGVRLVRRQGQPGTVALGGPDGPEDPLRLNDGRFLRLSVALYLDVTPQGSRLTVAQSSYQYQMDREGDRWIFRYDYLRHPPHPHPGAHLQVRGTAIEPCLPHGTALERVHFPTHRVSLEAVIRLIAEQFGVACNEPPEVWRPVLAEAERAFLDIAHRPPSGPER
jgi:hypothetical protein